MLIPNSWRKAMLVGCCAVLACTAIVLAFANHSGPCTLPSVKTSGKHTGMVWVPPGSYAMGDTVYPEEGPLLQRQVAGFWMDRTEVTNAQFAEFVKATGYLTTAERPVNTQLHTGLPPDMQLPGAVVFTPPERLGSGMNPAQWWRYVPAANWRHPQGPTSSIDGRDSYPVVQVTIEDAQAYARWKGHLLPTEVQWERAARAGNEGNPPPKEQPRSANTWQGYFPTRNTAEDGHAGLAPVGCFAPNAYGLLDMLGNAWELTADRYLDHHATPAEQSVPEPPIAQRSDAVSASHVIKGGSFLCAPNYCMRYRPGARQGQEDDLSTNHIGFRTIAQGSPP